MWVLLLDIIRVFSYQLCFKVRTSNFRDWKDLGVCRGLYIENIIKYRCFHLLQYLSLPSYCVFRSKIIKFAVCKNGLLY